jgi:hypothetical protein
MTVETVVVIPKAEGNLGSKRLGYKHVVKDQITFQSKSLYKPHRKYRAFCQPPGQAFKHTTQLVVREKADRSGDGRGSDIVLGDKTSDVDSDSQPGLSRKDAQTGPQIAQRLNQCDDQVKAGPSASLLICSILRLIDGHNVVLRLGGFRSLGQTLCSIFSFYFKELLDFRLSA